MGWWLLTVDCKVTNISSGSKMGGIHLNQSQNCILNFGIGHNIVLPILSIEIAYSIWQNLNFKILKGIKNYRYY